MKLSKSSAELLGSRCGCCVLVSDADLDFLLSSAAFPHRLNLFYLANDVIQNCKRKNAIVFRDTFAEVLPEAASLVK